jgi:6-phosphogluconolactonase
VERLIKIFPTKEFLEDALLEEIKLKLREAISKLGIAKILLSGGSTPSGLYKKLSSIKLD